MIYIVTQCFFPSVGGIEGAMTGLADHLAAQGHAVRVFADGDAKDAAGDSAKSYPIQRFDGPKPWRRWRKHAAVRRARRGEAVRGVFADSWKSVAAIPEGLGSISVLAHGSEFPEPDEVSPGKRAKIEAALDRADAILANSLYTAARVRPFLKGRPERVVLIQASIEPQPEPSPKGIKRAAEVIAGGGPVLMTLARLEPRKGVDMTLRALPGLAQRHPGLVYVVAGGGEDAGRLKALAAELGVEARVRFTGRVDDDLRAGLLAACDVFSMPVRKEGDSVEGFGLTYVEAGWYGAPSVAGREGGAATAVPDGQVGLLCDGADPSSVEAALGRLLDDETLRRRLGDAALARARAFTWDRRLPEYLKTLGIGE